MVIKYKQPKKRLESLFKISLKEQRILKLIENILIFNLFSF